MVAIATEMLLIMNASDIRVTNLSVLPKSELINIAENAIASTTACTIRYIVVIFLDSSMVQPGNKIGKCPVIFD